MDMQVVLKYLDSLKVLQVAADIRELLHGDIPANLVLRV